MKLLIHKNDNYSLVPDDGIMIRQKGKQEPYIIYINSSISIDKVKVKVKKKKIEVFIGEEKLIYDKPET
jgi:hypothetical protein